MMPQIKYLTPHCSPPSATAAKCMVKEKGTKMFAEEAKRTFWNRNDALWTYNAFIYSINLFSLFLFE